MRRSLGLIYDTLITIRNSYPTVRLNQSIEVERVRKGKTKKLRMRVTQPNSNGSNVCVATANGLTFTCWYHGGWVTND